MSDIQPGSLFLGWVLGILSPLIIDAIRSHFVTAKIRKGIKLELNEFAYRLVQIVQLYASKFGSYSREKIDWLELHESRYRGKFPLVSMSAALTELWNVTDDQLEAFNAAKKAEGTRTVSSAKSISLPYLESKLDSIASLPEEEQAHLLEIRSQLQIYNEMIEELRFYFRMTFDESLSTGNHQIITKAVQSKSEEIAHRAEFIVNRIDALETWRA